MNFSKVDSNLPSACRIRVPLITNTRDLLGDLKDLENWSDLSGARKTWGIVPFSTPTGTIGKADPQMARLLLERRPELKSYFESFPGEIKHAVFSFIEPRNSIPPHRDTYTSSGEERPKFLLFNTTLRFHIPLITNERAFFYVSDHFYRMEEGELWMVNNHEIHSAFNYHSSEGRYHLIFDVAPDSRTMMLLDGADTNCGFQDERLREWLEAKYPNAL